MLARPFFEFLAIFIMTFSILLMVFFPSSGAFVTGGSLILSSTALLVGHYLMGTEPEPDSLNLVDDKSDAV